MYHNSERKMNGIASNWAPILCVHRYIIIIIIAKLMCWQIIERLMMISMRKSFPALYQWWYWCDAFWNRLNINHGFVDIMCVMCVLCCSNWMNEFRNLDPISLSCVYFLYYHVELDGFAMMTKIWMGRVIGGYLWVL